MTGVSLDLITDPLMYNVFELGLRGGVSMIGKKFSKANHPDFKDYDLSKPIKNLIYLDANNLYGCVALSPLDLCAGWMIVKRIIFMFHKSLQAVDWATR